jgi:hypothetical protein
VAGCTPQPERNTGMVTTALPAATVPRKSLRLIVIGVLCSMRFGSGYWVSEARFA